MVGPESHPTLCEGRVPGLSEGGEVYCSLVDGASRGVHPLIPNLRRPVLNILTGVIEFQYVRMETSLLSFLLRPTPQS